MWPLGCLLMANESKLRSWGRWRPDCARPVARGGIKTVAVAAALTNGAAVQLSDRALAGRVGVSHQLVAKVRRRLAIAGPTSRLTHRSAAIAAQGLTTRLLPGNPLRPHRVILILVIFP